MGSPKSSRRWFSSKPTPNYNFRPRLNALDERIVPDAGPGYGPPPSYGPPPGYVMPQTGALSRYLSAYGSAFGYRSFLIGQHANSLNAQVSVANGQALSEHSEAYSEYTSAAADRYEVYTTAESELRTAYTARINAANATYAADVSIAVSEFNASLDTASANANAAIDSAGAAFAVTADAESAAFDALAAETFATLESLITSFTPDPNDPTDEATLAETVGELLSELGAAMEANTDALDAASSALKMRTSAAVSLLESTSQAALATCQAAVAVAEGRWVAAAESARSVYTSQEGAAWAVYEAAEVALWGRYQTYRTDIAAQQQARIDTAWGQYRAAYQPLIDGYRAAEGAAWAAYQAELAADPNQVSIARMAEPADPTGGVPPAPQPLPQPERVVAERQQVALATNPDRPPIGQAQGLNDRQREILKDLRVLDAGLRKHLAEKASLESLKTSCKLTQEFAAREKARILELARQEGSPQGQRRPWVIEEYEKIMSFITRRDDVWREREAGFSAKIATEDFWIGVINKAITDKRKEFNEAR